MAASMSAQHKSKLRREWTRDTAMMPRWACYSAVAAFVLAVCGPTGAQQAQVTASGGAVAIGRDVINSTINIAPGISSEQFAAMVAQVMAENSRILSKAMAPMEALIARLDSYEINQQQMRTALVIIGENDIPPERMGTKFVEIAEQYKVLKGSTAPIKQGDPANVAALRANVQRAIETGDLAKADLLLEEIGGEFALTRHTADSISIVSEAQISVQRGEIALTQLRYIEAVRYFGNAAELIPSGAYRNERIEYLRKEAGALFKQGVEFGDNNALLTAIERYSLLVTLVSRDHEPQQWGTIQNDLGNALMKLGERESDTAKLAEAALAFREALRLQARERVPFDWARTQSNLGNALARHGARERGTAKLEAAVAAYREALKEQSQQRTPFDWASTQNNLGVALAALGQREAGREKLVAAVSAYHEALKVFTRDRAPLPWAMT